MRKFGQLSAKRMGSETKCFLGAFAFSLNKTWLNMPLRGVLWEEIKGDVGHLHAFHWNVFVLAVSAEIAVMESLGITSHSEI